MISIRARIVRFVSRQVMKKLSPDSDVLKVRASFEKMHGRRRPARRVTSSAATLAGVHCEWLVPRGCEGAPLLYYLHGGAYLMGSPGTHRKMVSHIARKAGLRALLPDYSLAPEHPFPAGLNDCLAVYRELLRAGEDPDRIVVGGDSAGGGMSMAVMLSLRDAGDPLPQAAVLLSPWLDLSAQGESMTTRAGVDPWFDPAHMPKIANYYCDESQRRDPLVSPVYADVGGLPPMLVQVGDHEILLSDSTRLTGSVTAAGGHVTLQVWPDMWHVFQFFVGQMPESKRAIADIADFAGQQLRGEEPALAEGSAKYA